MAGPFKWSRRASRDQRDRNSDVHYESRSPDLQARDEERSRGPSEPHPHADRRHRHRVVGDLPREGYLMAKAYFMNADQYVRYDIATDHVDPGYPKALTDGWS